jgi:hypothetical protein
MELNDKCIGIIELLTTNNCLENESQTSLTKSIFTEFYKHFVDADKFIKSINLNHAKKTKPIITHNDIPKSSDYTYIIKPIRDHILKFAKYSITFTFNFFGKTINIYFTVDKIKEKEIDNNIYKIIFWLYVVSQYTTNSSCSKKLDIYVYFTKLMKFLPDEHMSMIGKVNVNTGYTYSCIPTSHIVIYRKEEWYKVFIHETIHNLGLDFSSMNNKNTRDYILDIFPINSDVKLYEAYTDAWAKILNVLVCSYLTSDKIFENYYKNASMYINLERTHCFFQAIKILNHMGLEYNDLYNESEKTKLFKEETSIFSYYICNAMILNNYQGFLKWCKDNNDPISILQFIQTRQKQEEFCKFIKDNYKTKKMLERVSCISKTLKKHQTGYIDKNNEYLIMNMRKSLFELK